MVVFDDEDDHGSTSSVATNKKQPHIDLTHFKSIPGILKIVQLLLVIFLQNLMRPVLLSFVVELSFILTAIWIFVYAFSFQTKYSISTPWIVLEFFYTVGAAALYLITTLITFAYISFLPAAICGFLTTVAYGAEAILLLKKWTDWRAAQVGLQTEEGFQGTTTSARGSTSDYTNRQTLKI